jgi:hypothetical protein
MYIKLDALKLSKNAIKAWLSSGARSKAKIKNSISDEDIKEIHGEKMIHQFFVEDLIAFVCSRHSSKLYNFQ